MELSQLLAVARGDEPADLLLAGGRVVNVFTAEILRADIAIVGERIASIGDGYRAREALDLDGALVAPGLIDAHVHVESSMVPPAEFGAAVLPHGVTSVISDPHEIANVLGLEGLRFMRDHARSSPLRIVTQASSCVPATHLATAGAELSAADLAGLLERGEVHGLAEVMNYPGVVAGQADLLQKIRAFTGRPVDGHCPGLDGRPLNAYVAAGIHSDHECTSADEARTKARLGMTVLIREGSAARNLDALLPLVDTNNQGCFCLCTDDRQLPDLIDRGSIDHMIRRAVRAGLDPLVALRLGTLNAARHFNLLDRGAVAPGRLADLIVFRDLQEIRPELVLAGGRPVAREGRMIVEPPHAPARARNTVDIDWNRVSLSIPAEGPRARAIGIVADQLVTEARVVDCTIEQGLALADPRRDLLKLAVIERHHASGRVGRGFVHGLGLRRGAIAGTVAHDHHNLIVAGADDRSMLTAAHAVASTGGGLAAADGETVLAHLPLPVAGLMSDRPYREVAHALRAVDRATHELGSTLRAPFVTLSFLGLEVIPALKLTDRGLVDVNRMQTVPLFVGD